MLKKIYLTFCLLFVCSVAQAGVIARSEFGVVATQDAYSANVGAQILEAGGNAVDAAVAIAFTSAVTYPTAGNLGGGGFMMVYHAGRNETKIIDYRETAPQNAYATMFLTPTGQVDERRKKITSKISGVPGTVKGLELAWKLYGKNDWANLIAPSIKLAEDGFKIYSGLEKSLIKHAIRLNKDRQVSDIFFNSFLPKKTGELIKQENLAKTLKRIQEKGSAGFYEGETADMLVKHVQKRLGLITHDDLKNYSPVLRDPLVLNIKGYTVHTMPPPSAGGVMLLQILQMFERLKLENIPYDSLEYYHIFTEALKRSFADRAKYIADMDYENVPLEDLISGIYARRMADGLSLNAVTPASLIYPGQGLPEESLETTHFTVADKWGNIVTNTYTLNHPYGTGRMVEGAGFFMNNEMDDFAAKPNTANGFGLIHGEKNLPAANKRPLSSMMPTLVFKDNKPVLATGAPGGPRIISAVVQAVVQKIFYEREVEEITLAPRIHHQWQPDVLKVENGLNKAIRAGLENMGHNVEVVDSVGQLQSVAYDGKLFTAMADPRKTSATSVGVAQVSATSVLE